MQEKSFGRKLLAAITLVTTFAFSVNVFAQGRSGETVTPSGAKQPDTAGVIAPFRSYSCGSGYGFVRFDISSAGTLIGMQAATGGADYINVGVTRSGYNVCWTHPTFGTFESFDVGETCFGCALSGTNMGAPAVSSGCVGSRFPCEITRTGAFGDVSILRRITGNSFVGPAPVGGTFDSENFNGVGCDTLGECGNCGNRTLHILTRVTNTAGVTLSNVRYSEIIDFDMSDESGVNAGNIFTTTSGSVTAVTAPQSDSRKGALVQSIVLNPFGDVFAFGDTPATCSAASGVATPTAAGDFEARIHQSFGTLGAGGNTGQSFRLHVRAF